MKRSSSPGAIYSDSGRPMDGKRQLLTQRMIDRCGFRLSVTRHPGASVAWVWMLRDGATFAAISPKLVQAAVTLVTDGESILILGRQHEAVSDIASGLFRAVRGCGSHTHQSSGEAHP